MKHLLSFFIIFCISFQGDGYFNDLTSDERRAFDELTCSVLDKDHKKGTTQLFHELKSVKNGGETIELRDRSRWTFAWIDQYTVAQWKQGDRLRISYTPSDWYREAYITIYNCSTADAVTAVGYTIPFRTADTVRFIIDDSTVVLSNGAELSGSSAIECAEGDPVFVFHADDGSYTLWHFKSKRHYQNLQLKNTVSQDTDGSADCELLDLEDRLNAQVLGQQHAAKALSAAIITHEAGLSDENLPVGVFLFLGPSGVGKTEMAKALAQAYYGSKNNLLRFDMSHFNTRWSVVRLIGSPPGYVDSDKGGQLTDPLARRPNTLVLLDEIEKADPEVRKFFLPVFDEGTIKDAHDRDVSCNEAIFIMTSNLCALETAELFEMGCTPKEVLNFIEPQLIAYLSPELYNRVTPIVFRPISVDLMPRLVDLQLQEVIDRFLATRQIILEVGQGAKDFLVENGYNQMLGARPLRHLIRQEIVDRLAYTVIKERLPNGTSLFINLDPTENQWVVEHTPPEPKDQPN